MPERLWILDTDHLSLHQRGHAGVTAGVRNVDPTLLSVTAVSLEESMRGWLALIRRAHDAESLERVYRYLWQGWDYYRYHQVLPFDGPAVVRFLQLRQDVKRVSPRDLKIAAIALIRGAILVTCNRQDFGQVPGLELDDWTTG